MKQIILTLIALVFTFSALSQTSNLVDGDKCFDSGDYACAITKYNEVIKSVTGRDKQIAEIKLTRARSCSEWLNKANQAFQSADFKSAKENYQNVLNENSNDSYAKSQLEKCIESAATIKLSKGTILFSPAGGNETVTITTDAKSYSITGIPSWCTVQKTEKSFIVSSLPNNLNTSRSGHILINAANKTERIDIQQQGIRPEIYLRTSRQKIVFSADKTLRALIDVETNSSNYIITDLPKWITVGRKDPTWFSLDASDNYSQSSRKSMIKVIAGGKEVKIEIIQDGRKNSTSTASTTTQKSITTTPYKQTVTSKKKCFNCPSHKEKWGLSYGYLQMAYDVFKQTPVPEGNLNGVHLGIRFEPLFKYGFGLNTGINFEGYSDDIFDALSNNFDFEQVAINIPIHLEYRLNFSKSFSIFAFGGAGLYRLTSSLYEDTLYPVAFDYGGGLRIKRVQFNFGKSLYMGSLYNLSTVGENIQNIGSNSVDFQRLKIAMTIMF